MKTLKSMKKRWLTGALVIFGLPLCAQDIHLSQFMETPILRNPALIGLFRGDVRFQGVYRNQWNSVTIPYQTGTLSGEMKFPVGNYNDHVTAGIQASFDRAGLPTCSLSSFCLRSTIINPSARTKAAFCLLGSWAVMCSGSLTRRT